MRRGSLAAAYVRELRQQLCTSGKTLIAYQFTPRVGDVVSAITLAIGANFGTNSASVLLYGDNLNRPTDLDKISN